MAATKQCKTCGVEKPLEAFHRLKATADGLQRKYKACRRLESQRYHLTTTMQPGRFVRCCAASVIAA